MASIRDLKIQSMGRAADQIRERARVTFWVDFSQKEVQENLLFGIYVAIVDQEDGLDVYRFVNNGAFSGFLDRRREGDQDDFIAWIKSEVHLPNGRSSLRFDFESVFEVGRQERGSEQYRAVAFAIPRDCKGICYLGYFLH